MTSLFDFVRANVTARQVAEGYGMRIGRSGRGYCPFHEDGRHPALRFYDDGTFFCFACHASGDAAALAAQLLHVGQVEAAKRICCDFNLDTSGTSAGPGPDRKAQRLAAKDKRAGFNRRWAALCEIHQAAAAQLERFTDPRQAVDDPRFQELLRAFCMSDLQLDILRNQGAGSWNS